MGRNQDLPAAMTGDVRAAARFLLIASWYKHLACLPCAHARPYRQAATPLATPKVGASSLWSNRELPGLPVLGPASRAYYLKQDMEAIAVQRQVRVIQRAKERG